MDWKLLQIICFTLMVGVLIGGALRDLDNSRKDDWSDDVHTMD